MEKKYLVVVYRNLRQTNNYREFIDKQNAENWYKYMLKIAEEQKAEEQDKHYYILDVKLYTLTEIE